MSEHEQDQDSGQSEAGDTGNSQHGSDERTGAGSLAAMLGILFSGIYLLNLTFGLIEIPDNLPIVGNIDEAFATTVLLASLSRFGIHLAPNFDPRKRLKD